MFQILIFTICFVLSILLQASSVKTTKTTIEKIKTTKTTDTPILAFKRNPFDPLEIQSKISVQQFRRYQEVEIKHARIAMLASMGILVAESFHPIASEVYGPATLHFQQIMAKPEPIKTYRGLIQITTMGLLEFKNAISGWERERVNETITSRFTGFLKDDYVIGDLNFDPLGFGTGKGTEKFESLRAWELMVGRLAMVGAVGMLSQESVDGLSIHDHWTGL